MHGLLECQIQEEEKTEKLIAVSEICHSEKEGIIVKIRFPNFAVCSLEEVEVTWEKMSPEWLGKVLKKHGCVYRSTKEIFRRLDQEVKNCLYKNVLVKQKGGKSFIRNVYADMGWCEIGGEKAFKGRVIHTRDGVIESEYAGSYNLAQVGSETELKDMFDSCIVGNIPMEAVACMGAAATALPFANKYWDVAIDNPINHISGDSTTGKSTATALAVSFGGPAKGKNGNLMSFAGTLTSILKRLSGVNAFPIGIDEFSATKRTDLTDFIYSVSNGVGKDRCTGVGNIIEGQGCETVLITNGEASILNRCRKSTGLFVRIFVFQVPTWTRSAEEAEEIQAVIQKNYGIVTGLIADALLNDGDRYRNYFAKWQLRIRDLLKEYQVKMSCGDRVSNIVALYVTAGEILNETMNLQMNLENILDFFFMHMIVQVAEEANIGLRAYDVLKRHFALHRHQYPESIYSPSGSYFMGPEDEGFVIYSQKGKEVNGTKYRNLVVFMPEKVDEIFQRAGFPDTKIALSGIHKEGLLRCKDKQSMYWKRMVNDTEIKVYAIWAIVDPFEGSM